MIIFNDNGFRLFLENIKPSKLKTPLKSAIRKSLGITKKAAKDNLKQVTPNYKKPDRWGLTLQGGIVVKVKKDALSGRVEIMSKSKTNNFKLKFFENGTTERHNKTRKNAFRGSIKATNFFSNAVNQTKSKVDESLRKNLDESLHRAFIKYAR